MARHACLSGYAAAAGHTESLIPFVGREKFRASFAASRRRSVSSKIYERAEARCSRAAVYVLRNASVSGQACAAATGL